VKKRKSIGVIGQGFVGTAVREKMKEEFLVRAYDKFNPELCIDYTGSEIYDESRNSIDSLVESCDIIFVCVPTPMFPDGECDTSIVKSVISDLAQSCESLDRSVIAVLKSTVPPGTTRELNLISKWVGVVFSPEFLTEANSVQDFKNQSRIVIGSDWAEYVSPVLEIFSISFPKAQLISLNTQDAEMVKYVTNLYLATKVSFFNDMFRLCQKVGSDYASVIETVLLDPRIGKSHYMVPGPDGDYGFGGHCFPKDLSAMLYLADQFKVPVPTLMGVHTTNQIVRQNRDWEQMEGRAVSNREESITLENQ
jgi:UDPglucose 6-dehydrogenase